jgi:hypothetical protein
MFSMPPIEREMQFVPPMAWKYENGALKKRSTRDTGRIQR